MLGLKAEALPAHTLPKVRFGWFNAVVPLAAAARDAYAKTKTEALPIAVVAERESEPGGEPEWFAKNMLHVVPVLRKTDVNYERVEIINRTESLDRSLTRLGASLEELFVRRRDFRAYLRWARTLQ